jgi:Domain of unknown function (DUF4440)
MGTLPPLPPFGVSWGARERRLAPGGNELVVLLSSQNPGRFSLGSALLATPPGGRKRCVMAVRRFSVSLLSLALAAFAGAAAAQTWSPDQQEIWRFEEQQWKMAKEKDLTWIDKMVHSNLSYWDVDRPAPQNKASLLRWNRYSNTNATVLEQELFPISVTITGNIAVVQYSYSIARENYKKDRETVTGRYTDVLVKEGGRWLFLAWAGGDDPKK